MADRPHLRERLELSATVLLILVALLVGGFKVWDRVHPQAGSLTRLEPPLPKDPVLIDGAPIRGDTNAKVALIEFSDFQCPYCARTTLDVLPEIDRKYVRTGKVFGVWLNYPLSIHEHAAKAAEAAECAGRQGQFWAFHDWAFAHQNALDQAHFLAAADMLGLDRVTFSPCLDEGQATARVQADEKLGAALSVGGTPTFFVGVLGAANRVKVTERVTGLKPVLVFEQAIERALAIVGKSSR